MDASRTVPLPQPHSPTPASIKTLSPIVFGYLQSISNGKRPLTTHQLSLFHSHFHSPHASHLDGASPDVAARKNDVNDFLAYMTSPASDVAAPLVAPDLTFPITSYFINSSHNTYLTGNQLYSESSTEAYKNVLLRGCRCIEIDVWDGESPSSSSSDTEARSGHEKKKEHRFRPHMPRSLSPHALKRSQLNETFAPSSASKATVNGSLDLPTPWVSPSTARRAEPRVLHGYTLTKEVSFREVCVAIRDTAFINSDLPIIVSLEVHAGREQQEIMVEIIRHVWKGILVTTPDKPCNNLPSPAELLRKILVKVKYVAPKASKTLAPSLGPAVQRVRSSSTSSGSEDQGNLEGEGTEKKKSSIIESLSALGVYTQSYHFKNLTTPEATVPTHVFSLSEKKLMEVHQSHGPTLFSHNRNFMMRAFPSGMRVSSSNLDPSVFWRKGVQIVALNWQKWDEGMMLNEGMFAGGGGWVLKPMSYRNEPCGKITKPSYESQADAIEHKTLSMSIEIFAGQKLPLPIGDHKPDGFKPYVKCELHVEKPEERSGEPIEGGGKSKEGEYKQRTKTRHGVDPDFGGEKLEFLKISGVVEELSFVRVKIHDDEIGKDDLAAWACIRLDRLQTGYRFVRLFDACGNPSQGVLLVSIQKSLF